MERTFYIITYVVAGVPYTTVADSDMKRDMAITMLDARDLAYTITVVMADLDLSRSIDDVTLNMLVSVSA